MRYRISQIKIDPLKVAAQGGGIDRKLLMGQLEKAIEKDVKKVPVRTAGKNAGRETCNASEALEVKNISIVRESIDARKKPDVKLVYTADFDCAAKLPVGGKSPFSEAVVREYAPVGSGIDDGSVAGEDCAICEDRVACEDRAVLKNRPVVVGFGPCGMFAGLILAEAGLKPIILERGKSVDERVADVEKFWKGCETAGMTSRGAEKKNDEAAEKKVGEVSPDSESNVQFGEGGAGTFSDGKLTTGIKDVRIRKVLQEFVEAGAPEEILYKHKPHIGTDKLRGVVKNIRHKIELLGGEIRFQCRLDGIEIEEGSLKNLRVVRTGNARTEIDGFDVNSGSNHGGESGNTQLIETDTLILAIGHSARDTFRMLYDLGFDMKQKPFSIGVRIEHPQTMIDQAQYGNPELAKVLGPADYKLSYRCSEHETADSDSDSGSTHSADRHDDVGCHDSAGRGVYTFCMCPGGQVVNASTEPGTSVTNGMSNSARDGEYANSAVLVDVRTSDFADHPLAGIEFQKKYEKLAWENRTYGGMARATYGEFRNNAGDECSSGIESGGAVRNSIPAFASEAILEAMPYFGRRLKGFDRDDAIMTAVESRSSSPVRVIRDESMEASVGGKPVHGIIPAGEGPGYAGGITSAAVDGIRAAETIIFHNVR